MIRSLQNQNADEAAARMFVRAGKPPLLLAAKSLMAASAEGSIALLHLQLHADLTQVWLEQ
jgi:hypothetical protein